ncbi:MAG: HEAT repeat domain-containing protein [Polyangiaceae bacterium]
MASREAIDSKLLELFEAERTVRRLHDELTDMPEDELVDALAGAAQAAAKESRAEEASMRLSRIASLLGEFEGPRVVDALIDVLASEHPEARLAAGEELEELSFERFKEVAQGVERALKRLPVGSPALPELPYILAQVPEPGVVKLIGQFLKHEDADAVAAAIESLVEVGDPSAARLLKPLAGDKRTVELAEEETERTEEVTIGELATEAIDLLEDDEEEEEEPTPSGRGLPS